MCTHIHHSVYAENLVSMPDFAVVEVINLRSISFPIQNENNELRNEISQIQNDNFQIQINMAILILNLTILFSNWKR